MNTPKSESDVMAQKIFLLVMAGAFVFLTGIITVLTLMPAK